MPDIVRVVGLDLSLTGTGVSRPDGALVLIKTAPTEDKSFGNIPRCRFIAGRIREEIRGSGATHVVVEAPVHHSPYAFDSGQLSGIVKLMLLEADIMWVEVPPASLKKFTTDNGRAHKDEMIAAAIRAWGFEGHDNNLADAHMLRMMGESSIDQRGLPKYRIASLAKVAWPWDVVT